MITAIVLALTSVMPGMGQPHIDPKRDHRPAQHIYIPEDYDVQLDARAGDTITVIMYPDGDPVDRCLHMGGEPIYNPYTWIYTCDGVDF